MEAMEAMEVRKLTAQDLMIGDWVANSNGNIGRVEGIIPHDDGHGPEIVVRYSPSGTAYSDVKLLRPIPLTPEILEKNGFKVYEQDFTGNTVYEFGSLDYMEFQEYQKYFNIGSKETYRRFGREITYIRSLMRIYFVHELQHAMRLCGIKKQIEL